ncbi:uncharacterized protein LOC133326469, partial [Musca vetustissima]|uniref:uncharacterized protein LOC133326469 n=1 Tax=Musca vetustissima TaxID=27455 RepID=UPI002AB74BE2
VTRQQWSLKELKTIRIFGCPSKKNIKKNHDEHEVDDGEEIPLAKRKIKTEEDEYNEESEHNAILEQEDATTTEVVHHHQQPPSHRSSTQQQMQNTEIIEVQQHHQSAAEAGNLDDFKSLYQADNTRLSLQDGKGRTAAHQAASRNRVNILRYIRDQNGDFNIQDNAGNTPIHMAVECDSRDALEFLLSIDSLANRVT